MKNCKLIFGDCIDVMKKAKPELVDLTMTSPPYDNLRTYKDSLKWDETVWKQVIDGLYRITKPGGVVVWVVGDATIKGSETGTSFKQALYFMDSGFNLHDTMIYEKDAIAFPDKNRYQNSFEYMFIFSKGAPTTKNIIHDRKNVSYGRTVTGTNRKADGSTEKACCFGNKIKEFGARWNIWRIKTIKGNSKIKHPAMFPEKLAEDHILSWSNPGDVVFDPFMGSGTTGMMALKNGRKFVGVEKVAEYFEISKKRVGA